MLTLALSALAAAAAVNGAAIEKRAENILDFTSAPVAFSYPASRGFNAAEASQYSCGGLDPSSTRASFPISGGKMVVNSQTVVSNVNVMYVANANPTTFHEFATVPGANTILTMSSGTACVNAPDFSTLNMTVGTDVTLLTIYQLYGNETSFYSCADVSLVATSDYTAPSDLSCANTAAIFAVASDEDSMVLAGSDWSKAQAGIDGQTVALVAATATNALAAATVTITPGSLSAASSDSGLSAAAGGGIGAGVTLAVVLAPRRLLWRRQLRQEARGGPEDCQRVGPRELARVRLGDQAGHALSAELAAVALTCAT